MPCASQPAHVVATGPQRSAQFYRGDCLDVMASLPAGSVDVIVTSPPYNMGIRYNTYDDALPHDEYLRWTTEWITAAARVLSPTGSLFLNVGTRPSDPWTALDVAQAARTELRLQNIIHWVKSVAIDQKHTSAAAGLQRDLAVGHYKPINSERFLNDCHEFVFHFTPAGHTPLDRLAVGVAYQDQSNAARWATGGSGVRCRGNTWFIPYETIQRRDRDRPHPATFPVALPEQCIRLHGLERTRTVFDPFTGLGSTAMACARLGVNFLGAELDEFYLQEAVARLQGDIAPDSARTLPGARVARMAKAGRRPIASTVARARRA